MQIPNPSGLPTITMTKNPNSDTRTATLGVTYEQFQNANDMHIKDVQETMKVLGYLIESRGITHDKTKKQFEKMYFRDFENSLKTGMNFAESEWYQLHTVTERHHLLIHCPEDVNFIDVLEMIADYTCAGMTRSGKIYDMNLNPELLEKALKNTMELVKSMIRIV